MNFPPFITREMAAMNIPNFLISVVDGGARDGGEPERWKEIRDKVIIHSFDPDAGCCAVVAGHYSKEGYNLKALPVALGACSEKSRPLHVTSHPASSSFFELNMELVNRLKTYRMTSGASSHAALGLSPCKTMEIETKALRDLVKEGVVVQPDFIKLDVQGAELEVLKGCGDYLKEVQGLEVEIWFDQVYKDQPLFAEVDAFLRSQGFHFFNFRFTHIGHYGGRVSSPMTLVHQQVNNGKPHQVSGQLLTTDAVYLRDWVRETGKVVTKEDQLKLLKTVVIAELVGQVEYAFEALSYGQAYAQVIGDKVFSFLCKKILDRASRQYIEANSGRTVFEVAE